MNVLKKALYIAIGILVCVAIFFVIAEAYSRVAHKGSYLTGFMGSDPTFHHIPPPYYSGTMHSEGDFDLPFTTNNRGMRGPGDYTYEKSAGTYRIAVMGDSFAFGVGVKADETASAVLADLLARSGDGRYEVYNFGMNSYSPLLEYIYLSREVVKYRPDMVILMLDLCDVQDDYLYEPHIVRDAEGAIVGCDPFRSGGGPDLYALLKKHSRFIARLDTKLIDSFRKIRTIGFTRYMRNKFQGKRNKVEIVTNPDIDTIYFDRFLFSREGKDAAVVRRHWERTASYLGMIKRYLDERGIRFILVVYPYGHHVGAEQWPVGRRYWGFEAGRVYDPAAALALVTSYAERNDIDLVSLVDVMRDHADEKLYYDRDGHLTPAGQRLVGKAMYDRVEVADAEHI